MNIIFCLNSPNLPKYSKEDTAVYIHFDCFLHICLKEKLTLEVIDVYYLEIPKVLHHHETLNFWWFLYEHYLLLTSVGMDSIQWLGIGIAMSTDPEWYNGGMKDVTQRADIFLTWWS